LGANKSVYFTAEDKNQHISFKSSSNSKIPYIYINNGKVHGYGSNGSSAQFKLYRVEGSSASASSSIEIPLKTINNSTGQAEDVEQINRNDFINAVVKVSYSKNQGHFIYEVKDWNTGGGDVNFN
jgi:hypothetical protein